MLIEGSRLNLTNALPIETKNLWNHWRQSGVFLVNLDEINHFLSRIFDVTLQRGIGGWSHHLILFMLNVLTVSLWDARTSVNSGVFRTLSNIYIGAFFAKIVNVIAYFRKIAPSLIFYKVLNTMLFIYLGYFYTAFQINTFRNMLHETV